MRSLKEYYNIAVRLGKIGLMERKGFKTDRKILVIESDDWGSIRMPSNEARENLKKQGVKFVGENSYDKYDSLASSEDLSCLIETLCSVHDKNGNPAVITLNTIVANPDFERIKESGYREYFYEPFTETLKRYPEHDDAFQIWKKGIHMKVFMPQCHGREHLNVPLWMRLLQQGEKNTLASFCEGTYTMIPENKPFGVMPAYDVYSDQDKQFVCDSIEEGLKLFYQIFGFKSKSFIAPCYLWDDSIEIATKNNGAKYLQGSYFQSKYSYKTSIAHYTGESNKYEQIYLTRNCEFEPTRDHCDYIDKCLSSIEKAFRLRKPAIISSHRENYIGCLHPENRENTLSQLKEILTRIVERYPDIEFMSSDQLGELIEK